MSFPLPNVFGAEQTDSWHSPAINGGGITVTFPNGWGVSIIRHDGSYGGPAGLFEAMPIDQAGNLFGEPAGWLNLSDLDKVCEAIAAQ